MTIEKFLHSCLRITHEGWRLLIDPGTFCFVDGRVKPEDLGPVDVILLTHEHPDHFEPEALRTIIAAKRGQTLYARGSDPFSHPTVLAHPLLAEKVRAAGLSCDDIASGTTRTIGSFTIEAMDTPHGPLPLPLPPHCGYLINNSLYHPGDSLVFPVGRMVEMLALPVAGPWCTVVAAVEAAKALRPTRVFPIHDAIIQPFFLDRLHWMVGEGLKGSGIEFRPAVFGTVFE